MEKHPSILLRLLLLLLFLSINNILYYTATDVLTPIRASATLTT